MATSQAACIVCFERLPDTVAHGLWCSTRRHFLCTSVECLLCYAENDETLLHSVAPDSSTARNSKLNPKHPAPLPGDAENRSAKAGRVPCCGSSGMPPRCWYDGDEFLKALLNSTKIMLGGTDDQEELEKRVSRSFDNFRAKILPASDGRGTGAAEGDSTSSADAFRIVPPKASDSSERFIQGPSGLRASGVAGYRDPWSSGVAFEGANSSSSKRAPERAANISSQRGSRSRSPGPDVRRPPSTSNPWNKQSSPLWCSPDPQMLKDFREGLLDSLNLRCPSADCAKMQDVQPSGCANVQCRWCYVHLLPST